MASNEQVLSEIVRILVRSGITSFSLDEISSVLTRLYLPVGSVLLSMDTPNAGKVANKEVGQAGAIEHRFRLADGTTGHIGFYSPDDSPAGWTGKEKKQLKNLLHEVGVLLSAFDARNRIEKLTHDHNERIKELGSISHAAGLLKVKGVKIEEAFQDICTFLPEAWQYPSHTVAQIRFEGKVFASRKFKETPWVQKADFVTPDGRNGEIAIYYQKAFPEADEGPFLKEERTLIDSLAAIISATASVESLEHLLVQNTERLKELQGINQTTAILDHFDRLEEALQHICDILPAAWQYPGYTVARIRFEQTTLVSRGFAETRWGMQQAFETPDNKSGIIEIFYLKEFPEADEGPFLKEERNLLINIANLISGSAAKLKFGKLLHENRERLKELNAINQTTALIARDETIEDTLIKVCGIIAKSWQYPEYTVARIRYDENTYSLKNIEETIWCQKEEFVTIDNNKGSIEVFYLREFPEADEGPFLKEERMLLLNLTRLITGYLNNYKGREIFSRSQTRRLATHNSEEFRQSLMRNKQPLQLFFNKQILDKYIYLDMMKYKVKDILFVATLYDAFILENEDGFFEQFMGEIYQYSLFSLPRITGVTSGEEALELLRSAHFDMVVLMAGIDPQTPIELSRKIKNSQPNLPVCLLLNQKSNVKHFEELLPVTCTIDKLFVWNGSSQIMFTIVKLMEDHANVENDTKIGLVRIILLIEDSVQYYSKYLQILYSIVFEQIQKLLPEVEKNEIDKISKMRSRPKILLARNYEDAMYIYNKYKDYLLCVISDMEFEHNGKISKNAGARFVRYVKSNLKNLPILLQSSDQRNKRIADKLGVSFINKNSERLLNELKSFLIYYLGFGDFIFRDKEGKPIATARTLKEFYQLLHSIPEETLALHAAENQYSLWLMSRGEIKLARMLNPIHNDDFDSIEDIRQFLLRIIKEYKDERIRGKVLPFDEVSALNERNIVSLAGGSMGGKGRGLAFINTLIYNLDFSSFSHEINIRTPITAVIGTDEFDLFMERNQLYDKVLHSNHTYMEISELFLKAHLSSPLVRKLSALLKQIDKPIAVRSSSLSEDSLNQPFAGVFDTYIVPNNKSSFKARLQQLEQAIKLVYASIYSNESKAYFKAIQHKVEEERMAVVIQELVGTRYGNYYYPHISGTAQSYNYYPIAHMKPEEGFAVVAVGLGHYVVGGGKAYRFSPKYPKIPVYSNKDLLNNTQVEFLAVDLSRKNIDYLKDGEMAPIVTLDLSVAEKHGTLRHCASVYNPDNDRIDTGINEPGPRIVNFGNILKYSYIPMADLIDELLTTAKDALGSPVEIEYAVDLNPGPKGLPSFYMLQIKPLVNNYAGSDLRTDGFDPSSALLYTHSGMGNGEIKSISDVVYIHREVFSKLKTKEMAMEVEHLNQYLVKNNRHYLLIGPGRWGTRDQFLGIPIVWSQISNARVIVEVSLPDFPLDASLGSHFFHNIISMNVGYCSVAHSSLTDFIHWEVLDAQKIVHKTKYFNHVHFRKPLHIIMNGKDKTAVILFDS